MRIVAAIMAISIIGCTTVVVEPPAIPTPTPTPTPTQILGVSLSEFENAFGRIGGTSTTESEWYGYSLNSPRNSASLVPGGVPLPCAGVGFRVGELAESASIYYSTEDLPWTGEGCDATILYYMFVLSSTLEPDDEQKDSDLFEAIVSIYCQRDLAACRKGGFEDVTKVTDLFPNDSRGTTIQISGYFITGFDTPGVDHAGIDIVLAD